MNRQIMLYLFKKLTAFVNFKTCFHLFIGIKTRSLLSRHPYCSVENPISQLTATLRGTGSVDSTGREIGIIPLVKGQWSPLYHLNKLSRL